MYDDAVRVNDAVHEHCICWCCIQVSSSNIAVAPPQCPTSVTVLAAAAWLSTQPPLIPAASPSSPPMSTPSLANPTQLCGSPGPAPRVLGPAATQIVLEGASNPLAKMVVVVRRVAVVVEMVVEVVVEMKHWLLMEHSGDWRMGVDGLHWPAVVLFSQL